MLSRGDRAPEVSFVDEDHNRVALSSLLSKTLVLFFYPKDDTPGCTAEACGFRDSYGDFESAGAEVIGVSSDDTSSHDRFRARHRLPFRLLSDPDGTARRAFGVPNTFGILPGRATFVISPDGTIAYAFNSQFAPQKHVANALAAIK
jgi:peroxiredoxin Q/BCP